MALTSDIISLLKDCWPWAICALVVLHLVRVRHKPGLRDIPGPFWASISDLWLFFHCVRRKANTEYLLHRKYNSDILRLGPNTLSVADSDALRTIYGWKPVFKKSRLYISQHQTSPSGEVVHNLSSTMDEDEHARLRRPLAHAYALSTLVDYEPLVDSTSQAFMRHMETRFVQPGKICDLGKWLQMYAFDVIGELTFSKRLGFLDSGTDVDDMMYHTGRAMDYIGMVGQLPTLDEWLRIKGFGVLLRKFRPTGFIVTWTMRQIKQHQTKLDWNKPDFLTRFIHAREKYPDVMTDRQLIESANSNVSAGSDTTAIVLRELVYRLLTHPQSYDNFLGELKDILRTRLQEGTDQDFDRPITWVEGNKMPYFQAIIRECLRIHPPLGQMLPRVVPEGGTNLCGRFIPAGTVVGCNAWTLHRDKKLYGEDADQFRPERWLGKGSEQIRAIESASFAFGGGPRVCLGKNIAMFEITKFMPEFLRRYELELVDPTKYKLRPGWLVVQEGLEVRIQRRDPQSLLSKD